MIGKNRAAAFQQAKADHDFVEQEKGTQNQHRANQGDPYTRRRDAQAHDVHRSAVSHDFKV
jgi:hypothetical protein